METITKWKSERFIFFSDAKSFQRSKQRKGYKTKLEIYKGIGSPYSVVKWAER
jgi:hypothetical protein